MGASDRAETDKEKAVKKLIMATLCVGILAGCSTMQKKADGRYFNFGSQNNSESSIELETIIVDNKWYAPGTGVLGCGGGNINGAPRSGSVSKGTPAPKTSIYIEWYAWKEKARMSATVQLPGEDIINRLLLSPPWPENKYNIDKSYFIVDFRPNHKVWIKLADTSSPKSENEVMILAEGQGVKTDDIVTSYAHFEEGEDYKLDCNAHRRRIEELGGYTTSLEVYDKWYSEFLDKKE